MDITAIIKKYPKRREFVLEILFDIQNNNPHQYIPVETIKTIAHHLNLPLSQVYGIIGYYSMLSLKPRGKFIVQVCKSPVCSMMGSESVITSLKTILNTNSLDNTDVHLFSIETVECLGQCNESPCMMINNKFFGNLTPEKIKSIIHEIKLSD